MTVLVEMLRRHAHHSGLSELAADEIEFLCAFLKQVADQCEKAEAEVLALRAENAELVEAMQHPSYEEENRLRAELAALKLQGSVAWAGVPDATEWLEDLRGNAPTPPNVPERLVPDGMYGASHHYASGWNDAIDEMTAAPKPREQDD